MTKIRSVEEFNQFLCAAANERMRKNIEAMRRDGLTTDQIADNVIVMMEANEAARLEALAKFERIMADPWAPSHELN